ncbi:MAG: hypothetical protein RRY08_06280 [Christensenella sp.]
MMKKIEVEENRTVTEQERVKSPTWWVGMAAVVAQGACAVMMAMGVLAPEVSAAIIAAFAAVFAYCNGNNPSIKGKY